MKRILMLFAAMVMSWRVMADMKTKVVDGITWTYTVSASVSNRG